MPRTFPRPPAGRRPQSRRSFLSSVAAGIAVLGAGRANAAAPSAVDGPGVAGFREITLDLHDRKGNRRRAVVYAREPTSGKKARAVVLLHGYGQASSERRALEAWRKDYGLLDAYARLTRPPLALPQRARYLTDKRIAELNAAVAQRPLGELVFVCPVTPIPYYDTGRGEILDRFAEYVEETLLPEVRRIAAVEGGLGLVGVSMGGQVGLELLLRKPALFDAFSGIMTAIERGQVKRYADRVRAAIEVGHPLPLQVITASSDIYRVANDWLYRALGARGLDAHYRCPPGIHTSDWMREVGCMEMLLWQDRTLPEFPAPAALPSAG